MFDLDRHLRDSVCSFGGVILIARPQVLFGAPLENPSEVVTSGQRMFSVTLGASVRLADTVLIRFHRAALIGVLGGTGSCESGSRPPSLPRLSSCSHRHTPTCDWKASACTSCALFLRFAMCIDFHDMVRNAPLLASFLIATWHSYQHDRIQGSPCDPNTRVVAFLDVFHRHIRLDCAGTLLIPSWSV